MMGADPQPVVVHLTRIAGGWQTVCGEPQEPIGTMDPVAPCMLCLALSAWAPR